MRDRLEDAGIGFLCAVVRRLPHAAALAVGRFLGRLAWWLRVRRDVAEANVARAFAATKSASEQRAIVRGAYESLGMTTVEFLRMSPASLPEMRVDFEGWEHLQTAAAAAGAVVGSAHLGNWELYGAAGVARGLGVTFVVQHLRNRAADARLVGTRRGVGVQVLERGMALRRLSQVLRSNHAVAILCDQDARRRGVFVPFFGTPASTHKGAVQLARRLGVPFVPLFGGRRADGSHWVRIHRPLPVDAPDEDSAIRDALTQFHALLEQAIRDDPAQYLWLHRRWKSTPERYEPAAGGAAPPARAVRRLRRQTPSQATSARPTPPSKSSTR